ncbi:MAG: YtxH domain-containing protein [Lachnospiraceae bacterium]|nr:YtxH domain-containing protein [Lachnospiraceae bacterium]
MALKDQWKETGKDMGEAFSGLGKNIIRSVADGVEKVTDWAQPKEEKDDGSSVFNDGSWRETGKDFGEAFSGLGKSLVSTAKAGKGKAEDWADDRKEGAEDKAEDVKDKAEDVKEAIEEKAEDVKEAVEDKVEDVKEAVEEKIEDLKG